MKSRLLLIILSVIAVAALCGCALFYQSDANNKVLLAQTQATLETLRAENDALKNQIAELEKKIETEKQEQEKAQEEAAKKAQEEALKQAQEEADKASSSSTVSKSTPPKTPAKPTTPGGTNGNNTTSKPSNSSKPSTPSNSGSGDKGALTDEDISNIFGGGAPKQSGGHIDGNQEF